MTVCISDKVRELWLKANPKQVERYTLPLYAADAITKLRAERDALAAQLTGYDAAREMLNVQDNKIDKLLTVLGVARDCIYSLDAREIYADELARIDAALAGDKP